MCDKDKRQQELEMMKMKAASEAEESAKAKAASQTMDKGSEVINIESPLIMTDDGIMKKVSEVIELPPSTTFPGAVNMNKAIMPIPHLLILLYQNLI